RARYVTPRSLPSLSSLSPPYVLIALSPFFFTDPATPEIYTLSLHDALPIWTPDRPRGAAPARSSGRPRPRRPRSDPRGGGASARSEEHTSELQSLTNLVCRLLLEKKKKGTVKGRSWALHARYQSRPGSRVWSRLQWPA